MIPILAQKIGLHSTRIEAWFRDRLSEMTAGEMPVYSSVDIRNAGFKISVIDTNLFPAGFNNLCETYTAKASAAFREFFRERYPWVRKILLFPEEHTRNLNYWKNIASLCEMLQRGGFEVRVGSASQHFMGDPARIETEDHGTVAVHKVSLREGRLLLKDFEPDLVLINNDLTAGTPEYLKGIRQTLLPSPHLGWYRRRKSDHFHLYQKIVEEVSGLIAVDPWLLSPSFGVEKGIDLNDEICLKRLRDTADRLLEEIARKYRQYGIDSRSYLFIKNNSGTYGMGMTHVETGKTLMELTRRMKNRLGSAKGGQKVSEYLLQEGIPTNDFYRGQPIEPVVYLVGGETVGTFFRIHEEKNRFENLNAPGMEFACLCYHKVAPPKKSYQLTYEHKEEMFQVTSLLGKIASLAAAQELALATVSLAHSA